MNQERQSFAQIDDEVQDAFSVLCLRHPLAAATLHTLIKFANKHNAVVISTAALARRFGYSDRSVRRAVKVLIDDHWIERRQIGNTASVSAYVINRRVCWKDARAKRGLAAITATVVFAEEEQTDRAELGRQRKLRDSSRLRLSDVVPMVDGKPVQLGFDFDADPAGSGE